LVERAGLGPAAPLLTFRVWERIDEVDVAAFEGQRLPDHRSVYLDYEGPLSPAADGSPRGEVRRVATGEMVIERETPGEVWLAGWIGMRRGRWIARDAGGVWEITAMTEMSPGF
jgi:hypothetical protein